VPAFREAGSEGSGPGVLEQCWQQVTGDSLPEAVRRFVEASQAKGRNAL
jgi:hypothetical protein